MSSGTFNVRWEPCDQCLFSAARIVSNQRASEVLRSCKAKDTHFICHKATINDKEVCCRAFYDADPQATNLMRMAARLGVVRFTDDMEEPVRTAYDGS